MFSDAHSPSIMLLFFPPCLLACGNAVWSKLLFSWQLIKAVTAGCRLTGQRTAEQASPLYLLCRLRRLISGLHTVNIDKLLPTRSNWMLVKKLLVLVGSVG